MRFVIVTGMSGAGKATALRFLEDAGFYCVDNLPLPLIIPIAQLSMDGRSSELSKIAVGIVCFYSFQKITTPLPTLGKIFFSSFLCCKCLVFYFL